MRLRKSVSLLAVVVSFLAASLSMTTVPAMAALSDCQPGWACWWSNTFTGSWGHRDAGSIWDMPNHCWSMGTSGNSASSFANESGTPMTLLDGACYGNILLIRPGVNRSFVGTQYDNWLGGVQPCFGCKL